MKGNLYQEAIADAKSLREMAEQNAKNKIIESITPQIRRLIEQQLDIEPEDVDIPGDEAEDEMGSDLDALLAEPPPIPPDEGAGAAFTPEPVSLDLDSLGAGVDEPPALELPPEEPTSGVDAEDQEVNIEIEFNSSEDDDDDDDDDEEILLSQESANALARLIRQSPKTHVITEAEKHARRLNTRVKRFSTLVEGLDTRRLTKAQRASARNHYSKLLGEAIKLRDSVIFRNVTMSEMLKFQILNILQEMKDMSNRRNRALFSNLFETGTDEAAKMDELDATLVLTPDDEDEEVEAEDLLGDLAVEFELETPGEEDLGGEGEEEGGEELGGEEELDLGMEEAYEIDEATLRRELMRMRRINENDPVDGSGDSSFGGGTAEDEMFVDVDEDTLLNALADELGDAPVPAAGASLPEARRRRLARRNRRLREARAARRRATLRSRRTRGAQRTRRTTVNESRQNRALKGKLNEYRSAVGQLRTQLNEMNLFNAKLLFANKLMQNRDLTDKQQRAIVEALDNAKTLNEAKLLYKSLTASLNKRRTGNGRSLTEGRRRVLASASRSTRSASPAGNGVEVDRWALLAGINGKEN